MKTSESIKSLSAALLKAQRNIGAATKGSANPFFKSRYADLGSVMEACKEALNNEGITVLQPVQSDVSGDYVETILLHESGEFMSSSMKLVLSKQDMQAYGSAVSYARRYSLQSLVFIPAEDDDGEKAVARPKPDMAGRAKEIEKTFTKEEKDDIYNRAVAPVPTTLTTITSTGGTNAITTPGISLEVPKSRTTFRRATPPKVSSSEDVIQNATPKVALNF